MQFNFSPKSIVAICLFFVIFISQQELINSTENLGDPYKILGVGRKASTQEIRRAYKQLAKEWWVLKFIDRLVQFFVLYKISFSELGTRTPSIFVNFNFGLRVSRMQKGI